MGGALKATFFGAVSGAVTAGLGELFSSAFVVKALGDAKYLVQAAAHGLSQGLLSVVQGGDFMSGFAGGALGSLGAELWGGAMKGLGYDKFAKSTVGIVAFGALSGGIGAELSGGNFWQGAVTGGIVAGLNHALHKINPPKAVDVTDSFESTSKGVYVIVETDGIGHVYMKVDDEVFSYGRYNGSDSPSMGQYGLTGDGVLLKESNTYTKQRIEKYPSKIYKITGVNPKRISSYYNKLYNSGVQSNGKVVVNRYSLWGQNCSTTVCGALKAGGYNVGNIVNPKNFIKTFSPPRMQDHYMKIRELSIDIKY